MLGILILNVFLGTDKKKIAIFVNSINSIIRTQYCTLCFMFK